MTEIKVVGGQVAKTASQEQDIIQVLESVVADLKSGQRSANRMFLVLADMNVSDFISTTIYRGRALEMVGLVEASKLDLMRDIGVLEEQ